MAWRVLEVVLVVAVVAAFCAVYLAHAWYGFDVLEEGYFLTNTEVIRNGGLPYRDFSTPYTPGIFYFYAWMVDHFGASLISLRVAQTAGRALFAVALYAAGRRLMPPFFAALAPVIILALDSAPVYWGVHPGWYTAPASVLAILCIARFVETGHGRWLLLAGITAGVAVAFKQNLAAYGLIASLWFLVVAERRLPLLSTPPFHRWWSRLRRRLARPQTVPLPLDKELEPGNKRITAASLAHGTAQAVRYVTQAAALVALPLTAAVIVRPYFSTLVGTVFVVPLVVLSYFALTRLVFPAQGRLLLAMALRLPLARRVGQAQSRQRAAEDVATLYRRPGRMVLGRETSFVARPLLLLLGFALTTLPWLWLLIRSLDWRWELLGAFVGKINHSGYFYGMQPPTSQHIELVAKTLLIPLVVAALGLIGFWGRRGVLGITVVLLWMAIAHRLEPGGGAWVLFNPLPAFWHSVVDWYKAFGWVEGRRTDDLILYLPSMAFWAATAYLFWVRLHPGRLAAAQRWWAARTRPAIPAAASLTAGRPLPVPLAASGGGREASIGALLPATWTRAEVIRLWYLAAGAALLLNQYPRMDVIHMHWSGGVLLMVGADVLYGWYRHSVAIAPALQRSPLGKTMLALGMLALPAMAVLPVLWWRIYGWPPVLPPPYGKGQLAGGTLEQLVPISLPRDSGQLWMSGPEARPIQEVVELLQEKTQPGEPIFAYPAIPGFYYLADRPNATRFAHLFTGFANASDQSEIVRRLEGVRYVVWDLGGARFWVTPGVNAPVTEYIRTNYRIERFIAPYAVLARDAKGPELDYKLPA